MIVAAHQPAYLPWLGYLAKIEAADLFVVMDDLQYEAQNFQNRNRIKTGQGPAWLTVPLERSGQRELIRQKRIFNGGSAREHWQHRSYRALEIHYGAAPYWPLYRGPLFTLFHHRWQSLLELDLYVLRLFMAWFAISKPIVLASSLGLSGHKTERIASLCRAVGAGVYLSGRGASTSYLDVARLEAGGVRVAWQAFRHPIYAQRYPSVGFVSHLSALDLLLNQGPDSARLLREALVEEEPRMAVGAR